MISEPDKQRLFKANIANIARKVATGKPLSPSELKLLEAQHQEAEAPTAQKPPEKNGKTEGPRSAPPEVAREDPDVHGAGRPRNAAFLWPIYETIAQAAERLQWPESSLKQLKKAGAPGFRFSRVYLAELIPWIGQRVLQDSEIDWGRELQKTKTLRERVKLEQDQNRVVDRGEVVDRASRAVALIHSEMDRAYGSELPAKLKGLEEIQILAVLTETNESFKERLRAKFEELSGRPPTAAPKKPTSKTKKAKSKRKTPTSKTTQPPKDK